MAKGNFYITTPIYYVNDKPHIGHAYTSVACDVMARFMRLDGYEVKFLTGTDEHGQKVEKSAAAAGMAPKAFVDSVSQHFRELTKTMNISNDDFIRTTDARHIQAAQGLWKKMQAGTAPDGSHNIYKGNYGGWYAVRDEAYYQESELMEKDGKKIAPSGAEVEWVEEESYFFALSKWQEKLLAFYDANPDFIAPASRRNEVISFVKGGLKDLSISRTTFKWGIPVPGDDKHIMYVWLDALTNYMSAVGYPDTNEAEFKKFWPADIHMVGKDILRFHAVYWPAFLMAANVAVPKRVFAHGWWTIEGEKMSKSLGNVVVPAELMAEFGLDQTRYFLLREVPFGNDGNFSRTRMVQVINSDLANNIGNLAQRTLSMINKNCEGRVPAYGATLREVDKQLLEKTQVTQAGSGEEATKKMRDCRFGELIGDILDMASYANEYIDKEAPWTQKKVNLELMNTILYHLAEAIRCIGIMLQPFMPAASAQILDQLAVPAGERAFMHLSPTFALKPGTALPAPQAVFPRIVEKAA